MAQFLHGYDLTDFGTNWPKFVEATGLAFSHHEETDALTAFVWVTAGGATLYTCNNPDTGQYCRPKYRAPEKGYASYMGITAPSKETLAFLRKAIKRHAVYIKGESRNSRDFV